MNPLLEQFLSEAREFLQGIGEKLMQLEQAPGDAGLMNELFRLVHTLKGNSGLFEFAEMTRVLHAGEDLMDAVKNGRVVYSQALADQLLDAMDFVGILCEEIESQGHIDASRAADSVRLAEALRALMASSEATKPNLATDDSNFPDMAAPLPAIAALLNEIPEANRMDAYRRAQAGDSLYVLAYSPVEECFYQGDDPFFTARKTPDLLWGWIVVREPWPPLAELDAYRCVLDYHVLAAAPQKELTEHYRYVLDQVRITTVDSLLLVILQGDPGGGPVNQEFINDAFRYLETGDFDALMRTTQAALELRNPESWISSALRWLLLVLDTAPENLVVLQGLVESLSTLTPPSWAVASVTPPDIASPETRSPGDESLSASKLFDDISGLSEEVAMALADILATQRLILTLDDHPSWLPGRLEAVAHVLGNCCKATGIASDDTELEAALQQALASSDGAPLLAWLDARNGGRPATTQAPGKPTSDVTTAPSPGSSLAPETTDDGPKFGRRADDAVVGSKSFRVDQVKVDRLMNLIGEMVVSKNALPYLAQRAENQYGVRDLAREIKSQYAVINRIAEEMQDAIMQVRMMAVSVVFQRFPRLVRDISRNLGKEVQLAFEGEETEADKNIIESLADPLIHIIRNSLDHGLETPEVRRACGKPAAGKLTIRAMQEGDRVLIEIIDDGKGIDPVVMKRKAYEKGTIDEATLERMSDREAINLVFAAGFSTAEAVSDLSGRGVGMDVVRTAVEKVNGAILLESEVGKGTSIRISLPLSMAVAQVMIIESDRQMYGVPMSQVVETVRVPRGDVRTIKRSQTMVLRDRIVPLKSLNALLRLSAEPKVNGDDELAVLVVRVNGEAVGLMVDNFRESVDVIQKPLVGVLAGLTEYSGSALMGDGSVLMVLDVKEIM